MRPTVQASATRPHRIIPRCSHYSIRTARSPRSQVHLHRDHPAGPLERLRLEATTRLARLCGCQWPLARLADDADSCAPFLRHCGTHPASHTHERARDRSRHGSSNRSPPTLEVRPQWLDTSGPGRDAIRSATLDVKAPTQQLLRINHAPSPLPAPVVVELSRQLLVSARRDPWAQHLH